MAPGPVRNAELLLDTDVAGNRSGERVGELRLGRRPSTTGVGGVTVVDGAFDSALEAVCGMSLLVANARVRSASSGVELVKIGDGIGLFLLVDRFAGAWSSSVGWVKVVFTWDNSRSGLDLGLVEDLPTFRTSFNLRADVMPRTERPRFRLRSECESRRGS